MLIAKGKPAPSEPWRILEVSIGQEPDILAVRLAKELKQIHQAVEALVPFKRNANGDPEWLVEHVYVRGANGSLGRLAKTPGIDCIRKEVAPADWIRELMQHEKPAPSSMSVGSFVRLLTGPYSALCGHVKRWNPPKVTVVIEMRTKKISVHTYLANLQPIQCPPEHQVFYYQPELFS